MNLNPTIGLEIHAELSTKSKMFCSCKNEFNKVANTNVCPVCLGMPGTLPIVNKDAVFMAVKAGLALNGEINTKSSFDRKNYFYPDLPKGYQITQYYHPIVSSGYINVDGKKLRINHIHLEEDAGKSIHSDASNKTYIDYNRCGVPLIEIVTEPDFTNAEEVQIFIRKLIKILKYTEVCDAKMEEGSLRADVNVSINFGEKVEIKNISSIKAIGKAIDYEIERQINLIKENKPIKKETRRFEEKSNRTYSMRTKEKDMDYRYFPEPDIPTIELSSEVIENIKNTIPILPERLFDIYINEYGLNCEEANNLIEDKHISDLYNQTVSLCGVYKKTASLILVKLCKLLNDNNVKASNLKFNAEMLAELSIMWDKNKVSSNSAMNILEIMFYSGESPSKIAVDNNMLISDDKEAVKESIRLVLTELNDIANDYKSGNTKVFGFLMGQVMKKIGKSANPKIIKEELERFLNED